MRKLMIMGVSIATSWWFLGLLGWTLVVLNYPIDAVLPKYAG